MGQLKTARQTRHEAGPADSQGNDAVYFDFKGVRFTKYKDAPGEVNITRLAANDPATWSAVWRCIKRNRPQLAALLMDPTLARLREQLQRTFGCDGVRVDLALPPETDMHIESHYIDTREGASSPFTPPTGVADYADWLRAQYAACQAQDGDRVIYTGLAQRVNALVMQVKTARHDAHSDYAVRVIGPHAEAVRDFLRSLSGGVVEAEVVS